MADSVSCDEFSIPVPWGFIKGLKWSSSTTESSSTSPWLALHGWLDNSGTFSSLAPLLAPRLDRPLYCIDLPGHGLSSHLPSGIFYHHLEGLQYILRVANGLKLQRFNLLGHSMGAGMAMIMAALYPERVSGLILLDAIKPMSRSHDELIARTRQALDKHLENEQKLDKNQSPTYTYEEARQRALDGNARIHQGEALSLASMDLLLKRGVQPSLKSPTRVEFSRDLKHMTPSLYGYNDQTLKVFAAGVKCPHLVVKAKGWRPYEQREVEVQMAFLELFKESNDKFEFVEVEGNHHVHLEQPQDVLPHILNFAAKHKLIAGESQHQTTA